LACRFQGKKKEIRFFYRKGGGKEKGGKVKEKGKNKEGQASSFCPRP